MIWTLLVELPLKSPQLTGQRSIDWKRRSIRHVTTKIPTGDNVVGLIGTNRETVIRPSFTDPFRHLENETGLVILFPNPVNDA
ncbi:hypothetical protein LINGRAHAP2_LOCUS36644 [Linum grandiflorum]